MSNMQKLKKCWVLVVGVLAAGCGAHKGVAEATGLEHGMAVINSDYKSSTALTLLDPNTHAVIDPCLSSGSVVPRLTQGLSGDVVLPSQADTSGSLVLIDRSTSAITWVDAATCSVESQLAVSPGFMGNPQDFARISATKAYVSRYASNPNGPGGNDLLIIDPSKPATTGTIDLTAYATDANVLARPTRIVLAGELAFVSLNNINADFSVYGAGRVLQIDTASDQVVGQIELPDARSCAGLSLSGNWLAIGCDGNYNEADKQPSESMVYVYDVTDARRPALSQTITAASLGQQSISSGTLTLHGNLPSFVASAADYSTTAYSGTTVLSRAASLGGIAITSTGAVFLADADSSNPAVVEQAPGEDAQRIVSAPKSLLPPRWLLLY